MPPSPDVKNAVHGKYIIIIDNARFYSYWTWYGIFSTTK